MEEFIRTFGTYLLIAMGIALILVILLFGIVNRQIKKINIPPDAGFGETLLHTPLLVVIFIDLLDFALDILAAPVSWLLLDRWGLKALRGVSAVEAIIPLTQAIPTLTLAWFWVRLFGADMLPGESNLPTMADRQPLTCPFAHRSIVNGHVLVSSY